jgi:hypothetical protein
MKRYEVQRGMVGARHKRAYVVLGLIVILAIVGITANQLSKPAIPASITNQIKYGLFYPKGDQAISIERLTFKYDRGFGQVSFVADFNKNKMTFAEQATPENFYASQDYYKKMITNMGGYYTFQNSQGKVDLVKDKSIGREVGVMNSKGTLIFVNSTNDLSTNDWREVFNSLAYQQGK